MEGATDIYRELLVNLVKKCNDFEQVKYLYYYTLDFLTGEKENDTGRERTAGTDCGT